MAQSLFKLIKQATPDAMLDVLAPAWTLPLLNYMPEVENGIAMPVTHGQLGLTQRYRLGRQLRAQQYSQALVLPNSWKSALIPWFATIPIRTGFIGECRYGLLNDSRRLDKMLLPMTVQRFAALSLAGAITSTPDFPNPRLEVSTEARQAVAAKFAVDTQTKLLALCPGAEYGPAKQWPSDYFAELAKAKHAQGWQVGLFGSTKDKPVAEAINRVSGNVCQDFTGRTDLADAVALLALADSVVSNDSGLMHVAAALDKPVIALFGSSSPTFTPPLSDKAQVMSLNLSCSPCFKRVCPLYAKDDKRYLECLTGIKPEHILSLLPS